VKSVEIDREPGGLLLERVKSKGARSRPNEATTATASVRQSSGGAGPALVEAIVTNQLHRENSARDA
jgi:hypothetical protein